MFFIHKRYDVYKNTMVQDVMHILFLTDNFPPEGNAPATRTFEHAREWVKAGHQVTIVTCAPNFPEGKVFPGYQNSWYFKEDIEGIEVRRVKTYISANEGFINRIIDYLSFMIMGFLAALFVKKSDVIIATSPQFFCACAGWAAALVKRKPFVFELRDMWPASITAVGAMKHSRIIRYLEKIEMFLYHQADLIISVTHAFKDDLVSRGVNPNKIKIILNGVDLSQYKPQPKNIKLQEKYCLVNKFVVAYIGTHGMAHALESIVSVAESLQYRDDIVFLFAGGGGAAQKVRTLVEDKELQNVRVLGRQNKCLMPHLWSLCDVSLVHLKNTELFKSVIPSKIFESMGMGLPIIIGVPEGEATAIVAKHDAGIVVEPENAIELQRAILTLAENKNLCEKFSLNSYQAASTYNRKNLANKMLKYLEKASVKNTQE